MTMLLGDIVSSCVIATVFGSCAILGLRYLFYVVLYERVRVILRRRGHGYEMYTPVVTEELWEGLGSAAFVVACYLAIYTDSSSAGDTSSCHLYDTSGCLPSSTANLTNIPPILDSLFLLLLAWYGHCTSKQFFGLGRVQGVDTAAHHAFTLTSLVLAYISGLIRIGILAHFIFTATNPLLSTSKLLHCLDVQPRAFKKAFFIFFTAAFFTTRVLLVPVVLLPCTLTANWVGYYTWLGLASNACLLLLYGISLFWFGRLIGILATGKLDATPRMVVTAGETVRWQKQQ